MFRLPCQIALYLFAIWQVVSATPAIVLTPEKEHNVDAAFPIKATVVSRRDNTYPEHGGSFTSNVPGCQQSQANFNFLSSSLNGEIICGLGWNPGASTRVINYKGTYQPGGPGYLAVHGWTRSPIVEYLVVDAYISPSPSSSAQMKGSVTCDGAQYDILQTTRVNQPSIDGVQTFQQFWSVRNPPRGAGGSINGTVSMACHANAWRNHGMNLGSQNNFQRVDIETNMSTVYALITVS